jgi:hypothetical protein
MRTAALLAITLGMAGCGGCSSCRGAPAELEPPDTGPPTRSTSTAPADAALDAMVLDAAVTVKGPVDKNGAQRIAWDYAMAHWKRYHPEQTTSLWVEHNGNYHVLVEFEGRKVVATVIVRPDDGSIDDAGIYVPD